MSDPQEGQEPTTAPAPQADASARLAILEKELKEARQEAARYRTERKAQEAAAAEAEQKRLAEAGEFKTLAEQRAAELAKLSADLESAKAVTKSLERYQEAVKALAAPQLAGLSDALRARVEALDPLDQLEWIAALSTQTPAPAQPARPSAPALPIGSPTAQRGQPVRPEGGWTLNDIYKR